MTAKGCDCFPVTQDTKLVSIYFVDLHELAEFVRDVFVVIDAFSRWLITHVVRQLIEKNKAAINIHKPKNLLSWANSAAHCTVECPVTEKQSHQVYSGLEQCFVLLQTPHVSGLAHKQVAFAPKTPRAFHIQSLKRSWRSPDWLCAGSGRFAMTS